MACEPFEFIHDEEGVMEAVTLTDDEDESAADSRGHAATSTARWSRT